MKNYFNIDVSVTVDRKPGTARIYLPEFFR